MILLLSDEGLVSAHQSMHLKEKLSQAAVVFFVVGLQLQRQCISILRQTLWASFDPRESPLCIRSLL